MGPLITSTAELILPGDKVDVLAYACTSASIVLGTETVAKGSLGRNLGESLGSRTHYELFYRSHQSEELARAKPIVLSKVLKHPSNVDFGVATRDVVTEVNGHTINSISDLKAALISNTGDFHRFRFLSGAEEALNIADAHRAEEIILKQYNIPNAERLEVLYD